MVDTWNTFFTDILQRKLPPFHFLMYDLKEQTEVAILMSLSWEFHNILPRKDKISLS